jgi:hypothetical protein
MTPEIEAKVDKLIDGLRESDAVYRHLAQLASHYQIEPRELITTLLTRQIMFAVAMTDFSKPGNPHALSLLLKDQNTIEMGLAKRVSQTVASAMAAIDTTEKLQEEATWLLARVRREQEAKAK